VSTVAFVVHVGREAAVAAAAALEADLRADGVAIAEPGQAADLVVAVGGDGTFLRAAHAASAVDAPVLGVKVGRMGFLTQVEPAQAPALIREALAGRTPIEDRLAVVAEVRSGPDTATQWAMNEIMVEKRARQRLVRLRLEVDGTYVTTFSADGVIVATPTGSTAYSFAARGPIVSPDVPCILVTPIAAHMVFDRALVLSATQTVELRVMGEEPGVVSADGRETLELPVGSRVTIGAAARPARFVRPADGQRFLERVRDKFDLPGDPDDVGGPG
jgi:NAD+ kinase